MSSGAGRAWPTSGAHSAVRLALVPLSGGLGSDYTLRRDGQLCRSERQAVVSGLRGNVRVEQRLDGSVEVQYGARYLPVTLCPEVEKPPAPPAQAAGAARKKPGRGSDWNKGFDLKKGPKVRQAAEASGYRRQASA